MRWTKLNKWVTHHVIHAPSPIMLGVKGSVEKNSNATSARDKATIENLRMFNYDD